MHEVLLYPRAEADLENIWHYSAATWEVEQANHYVDQFDKCLGILSSNPHISRERDEYTPPVRLYRFNEHLIVYIADESTLHVIRILHRSMDVESQLSLDEEC